MVHCNLTPLHAQLLRKKREGTCNELLLRAVKIKKVKAKSKGGMNVAIFVALAMCKAAIIRGSFNSLCAILLIFLAKELPCVFFQQLSHKYKPSHYHKRFIRLIFALSCVSFVHPIIIAFCCKATVVHLIQYVVVQVGRQHLKNVAICVPQKRILNAQLARYVFKGCPRVCAASYQVKSFQSIMYSLVASIHM